MALIEQQCLSPSAVCGLTLLGPGYVPAHRNGTSLLSARLGGSGSRTESPGLLWGGWSGKAAQRGPSSGDCCVPAPC